MLRARKCAGFDPSKQAVETYVWTMIRLKNESLLGKRIEETNASELSAFLGLPEGTQVLAGLFFIAHLSFSAMLPICHHLSSICQISRKDFKKILMGLYESNGLARLHEAPRRYIIPYATT